MFHSIFNINCIPKWLFELKKCDYRVQKQQREKYIIVQLALSSLNNGHVIDKITFC